jgi:hypothetical protein
MWNRLDAVAASSSVHFRLLLFYLQWYLISGFISLVLGYLCGSYRAEGEGLQKNSMARGGPCATPVFPSAAADVKF